MITASMRKFLSVVLMIILFLATVSWTVDDSFVFDTPYQVTLNGLDQTIMAHAKDPSNPILLVLHGGPGYAMLPLMHEINPQLEDAFTVVNWDQRGAGLSPETDESALTLEQLVSDAHELSLWLMNQFEQEKIYIIGHSFGTVIGLYLVKEYPDDYFAFIGVGQTVNVIQNEQYGYDWAYQQAQSRGDTDVLNLLDAIDRPGDDGEYPGEVPDEYKDQFSDGSDVTIYYISLYGGDVYGAENADKIDELILNSEVYDTDSWGDAWQFSQGIFQDPEVWRFDFKDTSPGFQNFTVPVYFFMGQHDYDTPINLFEEYYALIGSDKTYIRFENSAHFPFYEEPEKFRTELLKVKTDVEQSPGDSGVDTPAIPTDPVARADMNGDGTVGFDDFLVFASAFGSKIGGAKYDLRLDMDGDGTVAFSDFIIFASVYGKRISA
jgi:pimeloyl-ACP methyl ester carboxylesterase